MAKTIRSIKPNQGVRAKYTRRLDALLKETHRSIVWWLRAAYRKDEDRIVGEDSAVAMDASPARNLEKAMRKLTRRWRKKWDEAAEEIAEMFSEDSDREVSSSMYQALKAAGWTVKIPRTRVYNAKVAEYTQWNVSLIKSIGEDYLGQVESLVMRSAAMGRDVLFLEEELGNRFDITSRRAHFVARDQSNKITNAMHLAHCEDLKISEGIWVHVPGEKTSRPSHIAMNGKRFNLEQGMWDEDHGDYVQPGELPGCSCIYRAYIPEFGDVWDPAAERAKEKEDAEAD